MLHLKRFLLSFVVFLGIDLLWLGIIAKPIYGHYLGHLLRPSPNWPAAFLFYALFVVGLYLIAIKPGIEKQNTCYARRYGAAYGFFTYMTYELTNLAVIQGWPLGVVPIDIAWGTVLGAGVAWLSTRILQSHS